jgi:hypothetical protein
LNEYEKGIENRDDGGVGDNSIPFVYPGCAVSMELACARHIRMDSHYVLASYGLIYFVEDSFQGIYLAWRKQSLGQSLEIKMAGHVARRSGEIQTKDAGEVQLGQSA